MEAAGPEAEASAATHRSQSIRQIEFEMPAWAAALLENHINLLRSIRTRYILDASRTRDLVQLSRAASIFPEMADLFADDAPAAPPQEAAANAPLADRLR